MEKLKGAPITIEPQEGRSISVVGDTYRILVSGKDTNNAFATINMLIPPNGGPDPHSHASFQESFYITDGELVVTSEAGSFTAGKGTFVVIPKGGIVHEFKNKTDKTARLLCMVVPNGLEEFFLETGIPVESHNTFLPKPVMTPRITKENAVSCRKIWASTISG